MKPAFSPKGSVFPEVSPRWTASVSNGIKVSCKGTASSPTSARKIQFRPGNFIQAKA